MPLSLCEHAALGGSGGRGFSFLFQLIIPAHYSDGDGSMRLEGILRDGLEKATADVSPG